MKKILLGSIKAYQSTKVLRSQLLKTVFLTDAVCRYRPTCSQYTYEAIKKYGSVKGSAMGIARIVRCHPWAKGGWDPVK